MARAERPRGTCSVCDKPNCAITDEGGVRHHFTEDPALQAGPDSRKCRGVGQPPKEAGPKQASGSLRFLCRVPSGPGGCGHQVQLTANHRARTHLTPQGTPCPDGSSTFPIAVDVDGFRADTADWTEDQWAAYDRENGAEESVSAPDVPVQAGSPSLGDVFVTEARNRTITPGAGPDEPVQAGSGCGAVDAGDLDACGHCADCTPLPTASARPGEPGFDPDEHDESTCVQCPEDPDYCPSSAYDTGEPLAGARGTFEVRTSEGTRAVAGEIRRIRTLPPE